MAIPSALLTHSASVLRTAERVTPSGGWTKDEAQVGTESCRLVEGSPSDARGGGIAWATATGAVYFSEGADVARGDVLEIDGLRLRIIGLLRPSVRDFYLKAIVEHEETRAAF